MADLHALPAAEAARRIRAGSPSPAALRVARAREVEAAGGRFVGALPGGVPSPS